MAVRLPRIEDPVEQVEFEQGWLPWLAPFLPAAVPEPIARSGTGSEQTAATPRHSRSDGSSPPGQRADGYNRRTR
jgi:aminoglycoside phosphotransferase (APT) family kinase protein